MQACSNQGGLRGLEEPPFWLAFLLALLKTIAIYKYEQESVIENLLWTLNWYTQH